MAESFYDLTLYWVFYAFLGWLAEAGYYAIRRRGFYDRGFLSAPLVASYGFTFVLLILVLPTLTEWPALQYGFATVIALVTEALAGAVAQWAAPGVRWGAERTGALGGGVRGFLVSLAVGGGYYLVYLLVHPLVMAVEMMIPPLVKRVAVWTILGLLALDLVLSLYALRTGGGASLGRRRRSQRGRLAAGVSNLIWRRLRKAYPGIEVEAEGEGEGPVFAKGLCWDKLVWVFLVTSLLGDLIETVYCRLVGGQWMSRSSVLYGPFSFVWGLGAVVLTVSLQRLADRPDRYVFLAGAVIGGVYEYLCSVFTELAFGTVFWDYSDMPLNIGGRTNLLFCFFWGVLAVVWIKLLYPPLSKGIEAVPSLPGKVITWVAVALMLCNGVLTSLAMLRYQDRPLSPQPEDRLEAFLDGEYGDDFMERRWPNMERADGPGGGERQEGAPAS